MAWQRIELRGDFPHQRTQVILDGLTYTLVCRFNDRLAAWFLDIYDDQGVTLIRGGVRMVTRFPLFARSLPGFIAVDTLASELRDELADLTRARVLYADAAEKEAVQ